MTELLDTRRPRLLLTILCLLLWTPGFFTIPPGDRDESRFAQATKQMLETGDFVRIMNGTEPRNRKPIGIHWLQAPFVAAAQGLGLAQNNPIWPYRLPSALGGLVAVLACYGLGNRLFGQRAALLGAAMLAASVLLVVEVHIAKTDAALLGATTIAMAVLGQAYTAPDRLGPGSAAAFWLAIGAGVLLKGPITPMIVGLTTVTLIVIDRQAAFLRPLRAVWGIPLMLAVILPWFVAIGLATDGRFFADAVGGDLGRKLASGDDAHGAPPGYHFILIPLLLFPATAALPGGLVAAWRARDSAPLRFLLAWIVPSWLVFEAVPTKLPHYVLPLYPALCLLMAWGLMPRLVDGDSSAIDETWYARWLAGGAREKRLFYKGSRSASLGVRQPALRSRWLGAALAGLVAIALTAAALAGPAFLNLALSIGLPAAITAVVVAFFAVRGSEIRNAIAAILLSVLFYGSILGFELPRLSPLWIAPHVLEAAPTQGWGRIGSVGFSEPSLMFLAGTGTSWLLPDEAAAALADGSIDTLLVGDRDLTTVQAALATRGIVPITAAKIPGFNYSRGRTVTLSALKR